MQKLPQLIHLTLGPLVKNKRFLSTLDSQWISYTIWRRVKYRYTPKGSGALVSRVRHPWSGSTEEKQSL
jgi:hypothetical protein